MKYNVGDVIEAGRGKKGAIIAILDDKCGIAFENHAGIRWFTQKQIALNGWKLLTITPAPVEWTPKEGEMYFVPMINEKKYESYVYHEAKDGELSLYSFWKYLNAAFRTPEEAIAMTDKMLEVVKK